MGSVSRIIKKSPNYIKSAYYKFVPFRYRYGNVYGKTLDFLMKSQEWDEKKLKKYQEDELRKLLTHCYRNVPYYRDMFISREWHPIDFKSIVLFPLNFHFQNLFFLILSINQFWYLKNSLQRIKK